MQSRTSHDPSTAATGSDSGRAADAELDLLRGVLALLPTGVTVQDEQGQFLLVNDAASAQLGILVDAPTASKGLEQRRENGVEILHSGRGTVVEEFITGAAGNQVLLTAHRPVRIAGRDLLLSSSADISQQKALEEQLSRSAFFDALTDLPKRQVIEHRATRLARGDPGERFAIASLDIDNFKHINDYYGHAVGDALLVEFTRRLAMHLRASDMLARLTGDEFLLLLSPIQDEDEVDDYIHATLERLHAPFFIDGSEIFASTSIGVSLYPEHGRSFDVLVQNAGIALFRVKHGGKGDVALFDQGMEREALERMRIEQSLRLAILEKRFFCAFQPKVDIRTRDIKGIEALVRLRDDEGVIQAPGDFINLAVELGLIDEITHLVLAEIVKSIDLINETFGPATSIAINVAAAQAGNPEFMRSFAQALEATGFPSRFLIEVTEDAFVVKTLFQTEILPMFRGLGVGISIDDFGTGYSSLSALADITADEIKIDRSFITDIHKRPRSQGILRAIESLGEALGMSVIAEGIETFEELAYLQAATKIRYAQGYYFARPIFLEELRPATPFASESRVSLASRQPMEGRPAYARGDRYRR